MNGKVPDRTGNGGPADFLLRAARQYYYKPLAAFFNAFLLRAYRDSGLRLDGPVLDVGCFEGSFGVLLTESLGRSPRMAGIDLAAAALNRADRRARSLYAARINASATGLPFADRSFRAVLFNASLFAVEPGPEPALREARRVLGEGGEICISVPTDQFSRCYWLARLFRRLGFRGWAEKYVRAMDRRLMHSHVFPAAGWMSLLEENGFAVRRCLGFFSPRQTTFWSLLAWTPLRMFGAARLVPGNWLPRVLGRLSARAFRGRYENAGSGDPDSSTYVLIRGEKREEGGERYPGPSPAQRS